MKDSSSGQIALGGAHHDALPLPRPDLSFLRSLGCHPDECGWMFRMVRALNLTYAGVEFRSGAFAIKKCQKAVFEHLAQELCAWRRLAPQVFAEWSWQSFFDKHSINYCGEVVKVAEEVTWESLEPGLPPPGMAGVIDACSVCTGGTLHYVKSPRDYLLPECQWASMGVYKASSSYDSQ